MKKLKFLLFILPFVFVSNVNAGSINEVMLFGHRLDDEWSISPNGSTIGTADYFLFTDGSVPNYLYADVCTTGNAPTVWVTGFGGNTRVSPDTKVYRVNKPCSVAGYSANIYRFTFYVTSYDDAGNGNLGLQFNTRLFSNTDYNTFFRLLSITYSNSLSYSDIDLSNQQNIIDQNNQIISGQQDIKDSVNNVDDTLKDDSIDSTNTTGTLSDLSDSLPTNSVISDLLLLPVRLFQKVLNSINGSCTTFNLGSLFGTDLTLPCLNIESLLGSTLWTVIDILFCGAFVLVIRKKFVDIFDGLSNLKNGGNSVE